VARLLKITEYLGNTSEIHAQRASRLHPNCVDMRRQRPTCEGPTGVVHICM
jgi:hypothetical protein